MIFREEKLRNILRQELEGWLSSRGKERESDPRQAHMSTVEYIKLFHPVDPELVKENDS